MSFNIVKKSGSTCLVRKFRDPNNPSKVIEKYLLSMGVQTDVRHKEIRSQVNELAQEDRVAFCEHSGLIVETKPDTPRRKAPTGDIRPITLKGEKSKKVSRKSEKKTTTSTAPINTQPETQSTTIGIEKPKGMPVDRYKTVTAKKDAITRRISLIESRIDDQAIYLKHYKSRQGDLTTSEKQMRRDEAEGYINYATEGKKAITILRKQRSEIR